MINNQDILQKTFTVKKYLEKTAAIYKDSRKSGEKKDFYKTVKPFVEEIDAVVADWSVSAKEWVRKARPKNLYEQQIDAAVENIKEVSVQAFDPNSSKSRFYHHIRSINYTLEKIMMEMERSRE